MNVFGDHPAHAPANFLVWTSGSPPIVYRFKKAVETWYAVLFFVIIHIDTSGAGFFLHSPGSEAYMVPQPLSHSQDRTLLQCFAHRMFRPFPFNFVGGPCVAGPFCYKKRVGRCFFDLLQYGFILVLHHLFVSLYFMFRSVVQQRSFSNYTKQAGLPSCKQFCLHELNEMF